MDRQNLEKNFISAVIYLNTAENDRKLSDFIARLARILSDDFLKYEIICVDDGSPQEYLDAVKRAISESTFSFPVTILHMSFYQGMELAMNAGRDLAIGDYVLEFDECVWNFPDDMIMQAYREVLKECDIVCCADRTKEGVTSKAFYELYNRFSGTQHLLESDNFRILSRRGINRVCSLNRSIPYRKAVYANCGLRFKVMHFEPAFRTNYGKDKKTRRFRKNLALDALLLYTDIGTRFSMLMAGLMALIAAVLAVYSLAVYLNGIAVVGWTTTMLFLSFGFFGFFALMAVVIKYLSLILNIVFRKEKYLFQSIEKL